MHIGTTGKKNCIWKVVHIIGHFQQQEDFLASTTHLWPVGWKESFSFYILCWISHFFSGYTFFSFFNSSSSSGGFDLSSWDTCCPVGRFPCILEGWHATQLKSNLPSQHKAAKQWAEQHSPPERMENPTVSYTADAAWGGIHSPSQCPAHVSKSVGCIRPPSSQSSSDRSHCP